MNSEDSETSESHRPLFNLAVKINLKKSDKYVDLYGIILKKSCKSNKFKTSAGLKNLIYLMDRILYQILKIISNVFKKHSEKANTFLIGINI